MSKGVLVETDLLVEFLLAPQGSVPLLRRLLQTTSCFSTFIQASEIYAASANDEERRILERPLFGLKILGASSRYATTIGGALSSANGLISHRNAIVAAMAIESNLPVVTDTFARGLGRVKSVRVISAAELRNTPDNRALIDLLEFNEQISGT